MTQETQPKPVPMARVIHPKTGEEEIVLLTSAQSDALKRGETIQLTLPDGTETPVYSVGERPEIISFEDLMERITSQSGSIFRDATVDQEAIAAVAKNALHDAALKQWVEKHTPAPAPVTALPNPAPKPQVGGEWDFSATLQLSFRSTAGNRIVVRGGLDGVELLTWDGPNRICLRLSSRDWDNLQPAIDRAVQVSNIAKTGNPHDDGESVDFEG